MKPAAGLKELTAGIEEVASMFRHFGRNFGALLLLAAIGPAQAQDRGNAAAVLARYIARSADPEWTTESVDVDASLPKLERTGRLHAIRRLLPGNQPKYQVLQLTGDRTVKEQVIARYLKTEQQAAEMPAVSVAVTPANYKFTYKASISDTHKLAYIFEITPRKKRDGLIKGEIWLDGETATAVRYAGRLVKRPSVFVKSVDVQRDTTLRNGVVESRLTHLTVDTRLVGKAELTIEERPLNGPEISQVTGAGNGGGEQ
jgi:hypothetical protein